jgi:predicted outer membrane repeat protein
MANVQFASNSSMSTGGAILFTTIFLTGGHCTFFGNKAIATQNGQQWPHEL